MNVIEATQDLYERLMNMWSKDDFDSNMKIATLQQKVIETAAKLNEKGESDDKIDEIRIRVVE